MKGLGRILLIIFAVLAVIGLVWVGVSPNSAGAEVDQSAWMDNPLTSYMIWVSVIAVAVTVIAFLIYKVVDLIKHPSHLREALWVFGAIIVAAVLGFLFSGSGDIIYGNGEVYEGGMNSKLIGTGIISAGILLLVGLLFLIYDTIKGIITG